MSYNKNEPVENYFDDIDPPIEEDEYDDDETFGDTGPLNNEWESNQDLLSNEHEAFLSSNPIKKRDDFSPEDDEDEEDDDHNEQNGVASYHNERSTFFNSNSRKVGLYTSLNNDDDHHTNMDDDQIESVFKIAMGEHNDFSVQTSKTTKTTTTTTINTSGAEPSSPFKSSTTTTTTTSTATTAAATTDPNPLLKLMSNLSVVQQTPNIEPTPEVNLKAVSLSDLEAQLESQISLEQQQQQQQQSPQPKFNKKNLTPQKTNNRQSDSPIKNNVSSPNNANNNNNINNNNNNNNINNNHRYPRPLTIGDMMPATRQKEQQQQNQQQQQQQQNYHSPRKNIKKSHNAGDKKYMTAEEIQTINRLQAYQIHFTNPYIEDYYYQRHKMKNTPPSHSHTPICDSQPKQGLSQIRKPGTTDPLTGALGRIPSHSIRAPRQILQIILNNESDQDSRNQNSDQTIKLVIESSYTHILDLEDINFLISSTNDQTLLAEYYTKKEPVSNDLFRSLHLDPFPSFKFESPTLPQQEANQKWPSVCQEDLLFVSLWVYAKGRKLIKRAFPLLNDKQSLSGLFAVCRNLPLLLLLHLPEGSEKSTEEIYKQVIKWILEVPIKFFILGFHFLVNFNQSKFLVKLFQTKEGLSIIHTFLTKGLLIFDPIYLSQNNLIHDALVPEQWRDVFDRFFNRLTGHFQTIFPPNQQPTQELQQLFSLLLTHSSEKQKLIFHRELGLI